jgi:hypothetical protein
MLETGFTYNSSNSAYNNTVNNTTTQTGTGTTPATGSTAVNVTVNSPTSRTISFTISSSPNGAAIFIDGVNSGFVTPHVMRYTETELLTPKLLSVRNGSATSTETYRISSELVTQTSDGTSPTGQGGYGGGYNPVTPRATGSAAP